MITQGKYDIFLKNELPMVMINGKGNPITWTQTTFKKERKKKEFVSLPSRSSIYVLKKRMGSCAVRRMFQTLINNN